MTRLSLEAQIFCRNLPQDGDFDTVTNESKATASPATARWAERGEADPGSSDYAGSTYNLEFLTRLLSRGLQLPVR